MEQCPQNIEIQRSLLKAEMCMLEFGGALVEKYSFFVSILLSQLGESQNQPHGDKISFIMDENFTGGLNFIQSVSTYCLTLLRPKLYLSKFMFQRLHGSWTEKKCSELYLAFGYLNSSLSRNVGQQISPINQLTYSSA